MGREGKQEIVGAKSAAGKKSFAGEKESASQKKPTGKKDLTGKKNSTGQKDSKGITASKSADFSEWYTQVIHKAELADYSAVSGCIVYRPYSFAIWEKIQQAVDSRLKKAGVKNCYFPLFIPESLLQKEATHVEGFAPECAWVTQGGNTQLGERLAIRPTSETIMYDSFSKWIRSHNDLPLRLNQWNNVVRWEFKHPVPFLRTREFLWNEGHTCFASREEAEAEGEQIVGIYKEVCEHYLALPPLAGKKSEKEKFAGAEYTISLEFLMPNGRGIQGPDFHHDGQNFAKAFNISFLDKNGERQFAWQNTWAISTRMLGVLIAVHGDDKGLVLPPRLAPVQVVIVPIYFDDSREKVAKAAQSLALELRQAGLTVLLDEREHYSPGWKFNEWEVKGVPLRIEIGPRDLQKKQVTIVRRDTGEKGAASAGDMALLKKHVSQILEDIQKTLFLRAEKSLRAGIATVKTLPEAEKALKEQKLIFAAWCGRAECEERFKEQSGAKSLNSPLQQEPVKGSCFACGKEAMAWFYFGKSY